MPENVTSLPVFFRLRKQAYKENVVFSNATSFKRTVLPFSLLPIKSTR